MHSPAITGNNIKKEVCDMTATAIISRGAGKDHQRKGMDRSRRAVPVADVIGSLAHLYQQAADKAENPEVRTMFQSMAEEEKIKLESLGSVVERSGAAGSTIRKMISAFEKRERSLLKKIGAETDEVEALKVAMEIETESIRLYGKLLPEVKTPGQKAIISRLIREEQQRYATFENTCLFLSDPAGWYMWNEQSFADGGTSCA
jgi:ferritin-like metal-binding protein YciE